MFSTLQKNASLPVLQARIMRATMLASEIKQLEADRVTAGRMLTAVSFKRGADGRFLPRAVRELRDRIKGDTERTIARIDASLTATRKAYRNALDLARLTARASDLDHNDVIVKGWLYKLGKLA